MLQGNVRSWEEISNLTKTIIALIWIYNQEDEVHTEYIVISAAAVNYLPIQCLTSLVTEMKNNCPDVTF